LGALVGLEALVITVVVSLFIIGAALVLDARSDK
jgi:hypothetical protein